MEAFAYSIWKSMSPYEYFGKILDISPATLEKIDADIVARGKKKRTLQELMEKNQSLIEKTLGILDSTDRSASHVRSVLRKAILAHEKQFMEFLDIVEGDDLFQKEAHLAKKIAKVGKGLFLNVRPNQ
jgi:hypothetical protein